MGKCDCGAATDGKWADKHHPNCPALIEDEDRPLTAEEQAMIDRAWEIHKAAAPKRDVDQ